MCFAGAVDAYLKAGVPPSKLMLGLATYGRTFQLTADGDAPGVVTANGESVHALNLMSVLCECVKVSTLSSADWLM